MTLDLNFPKLVLDPGNEAELIQLAYTRIQTASGNTITDFRPGSAIAALVEGQTFALAELLYYLNLLPEAIAIEVFRLYGITRSLGTPATGALTFLLTDVAVDTFSLPAGYAIPYLDSSLILSTALYIPSGAQEGTVDVTAADVGSIYNAKPFDILATGTGLARVQSIFNRLPLSGGSDLEPLELLIPRCQAATVSRSAVITKLDYELSVQTFLGSGSRATAVPNLSADGISFLQSAVAVFCLDAAGQPTTAVANAAIKADLSRKILIGTSVTCFPAVLQNITTEITISVYSIDEVIARAVISKVMAYLNPVTYGGGLRVRDDEIQYRARQVDKVLTVDSVTLNTILSTDVVFANGWTYPVPAIVAVTMNDASGRQLVITGGLGFGDVYNDDEDV
jgi:Baseplate J-like protein